jgi:hypothetical protein
MDGLHEPIISIPIEDASKVGILREVNETKLKLKDYDLPMYSASPVKEEQLHSSESSPSRASEQRRNFNYEQNQHIDGAPNYFAMISRSSLG